MNYYTPAQIADLVGIREGTILDYCRKGTIKAVKSKTGWYVSEPDLATWLMEKGNRKIPRSEVARLLEEYATSDISLQAIGERYGLTRERVRQLFREIDPSGEATKRHRAALSGGLYEKRRYTWEKLAERMQFALDNDLRCPVDGSWVLRTKGRSDAKRTCSPECARAWLVIRNLEGEGYERHRRETAKTVLNGNYSETLTRHAAEVVGDNPPPPNRRYLVPGSERAKIVEKYRPELYKMLAHSRMAWTWRVGTDRIGPFKNKATAKRFGQFVPDGVLEEGKHSNFTPADWLEAHPELVKALGVEFEKR